MQKKNKIMFTSGRLVLYSLLAPSFLFLVFFTFNGLKFQMLIFSFFAYLFMFAIFCIPFHKAFTIVSITPGGVCTRKVKIHWSEIRYIHTVDMELFKYNLCKTRTLEFLCINKGEVKINRFDIFSGDCIFIPFNEKNLKLIFDYSEGASSVINEYVKYYGWIATTDTTE